MNENSEDMEFLFVTAFPNEDLICEMMTYSENVSVVLPPVIPPIPFDRRSRNDILFSPTMSVTKGTGDQQGWLYCRRKESLAGREVMASLGSEVESRYQPSCTRLEPHSASALVRVYGSNRA